jgi:hypothetical protein
MVVGVSLARPMEGVIAAGVGGAIGVQALTMMYSGIAIPRARRELIGRLIEISDQLPL